MHGIWLRQETILLWSLEEGNMSAKKHFFTRNKKLLHEPLGKTPKNKNVGNKSVNIREKETGREQSSKLVAIKQNRKPELPIIYRKITESIYSWVSLKKIPIILCLLLLLGLSFYAGFLLIRNVSGFVHSLSQREKLMQEENLWENIVQRYPSYRDAYFQLAVISYRLGDPDQEREFLNKTLQIDPNFVPAQNLQNLSK